jgi:hypothetical protein
LLGTYDYNKGNIILKNQGLPNNKENKACHKSSGEGTFVGYFIGLPKNLHGLLVQV